MLPNDGTAVIVGGSIAGVTSAEELRSAGHAGPIVVVDDQVHPPYARPPLSKAVLTGEDPFESIALPPMNDATLTFVSGARAVDVSVEEASVTLSNGRRIHWDGLIIASGARPTTMSDIGKNADGLPETVLRTIDDARVLRDSLSSVSSVAVIGGGILGMEIASAAVAAGVRTTVISNEPPLRSQCGQFISNLVRKHAMSQGVEFVIHSDGARLVTAASAPAVAIGGRIITADLTVTAIGDTPNVEWLVGSKLADRRGVRVDSRCRVTPNIVAAGDITTHGTDRRRSPHWSAAIEQARTASLALMFGDDAPELRARPYFWTDQFGLSLKMTGGMPFDGIPTVVEGSIEDSAALLQWTSNGEPIGALALNHRIALSRLHRVAGTSDPRSTGVRK